MRVRVYEDQPWSGRYNVLTVDFFTPNVSGHYTVSASHFLAQSDRCWAYPTDDPRAWAYHVGMYTDFEFDLTVTGSNIVVDITAFSDWSVHRDAGATPSGMNIVQGNYSWYSSLNGNLIYHYVGPTTSGQGNAVYYGPGGTMSFSSGTLRPQQESSAREFANMLNHVNGNRAQAKIVFFNDFPPDYRPGAIRNGNIYLSHNRDGGEAHILNGSWNEMRTIGGGVEHDNIPSIRKNDSWFNQLKLGKE